MVFSRSVTVHNVQDSFLNVFLVKFNQENKYKFAYDFFLNFDQY